LHRYDRTASFAKTPYVSIDAWFPHARRINYYFVNKPDMGRWEFEGLVKAWEENGAFGTAKDISYFTDENGTYRKHVIKLYPRYILEEAAAKLAGWDPI